MKSENSNPFVLPGFGQAGDLSQNPLLASMEMMRQAWQGLAASGVLAQPPVSSSLTTDDLDRRISDLRAVENWLRINMSMLTSSIQALEVQRATIATLKSFANIPGAPADSGDNPSPLEVALGIKPSGQAKIKTPSEAGEASSGTAEGPDAKGPGLPGDPAALSEAAQGWWTMLQKQFDTLAAATVAGMQVPLTGSPGEGKQAGAAPKRSTRTAQKAAGEKTVAKRAAGKKVATTTKAARTARKSAGGRLAGRKS